ncbi:MAG: hypothetical protein J6X44_11490, partial [Thermoguttaceae bacterium]|nr:hypothetical protein [Thermoguttaceae bacterium]
MSERPSPKGSFFFQRQRLVLCSRFWLGSGSDLFKFILSQNTVWFIFIPLNFHGVDIGPERNERRV